ncbi:IPT/TIG domain-containing protein, partial [Legionella bozemanae]|uniref:IPT/TIG domain-containing protein n=1 Tax=Legionella bozemanae TaxID=447 RepID=UPI00399CA2F4
MVKDEKGCLTRWFSRVVLLSKQVSKQVSKGCLRRFIASLLIYSQFIQLSAAAVLPNSPPQVPLSSASQQGRPMTTNTPLSAGPFTPLVNYAQTGTLNNLSLTNQQLGFSGPLNWGVTYSDLTGTYFNAQYVLPLGERLALGALGEYGSGQYRINGTLGYGFSPTAQMKFTAERFGQRLPFQFDSGDIESRVHQDAYGVRFQQLFNAPFLQGFNLGGYYADASSKNLNPVIFTSDVSNCGGFASGLQCINYRHLAGATSTGADVGIDVLLTPSTLVSGNLYYDQVRYNPIFSPTSDEDRNGLGGGVRLNQLLGERFKFTGEATVREIYDTYQAGLSWLSNFQKMKLGIELSLFGQHVTSHNATPDNNSIGLQVNFLADGSRRYDERHRWGSQRLSDIAQWVTAPAVKMNQVMVIAEQVTRLLAPSIMGITPSSGPFVGGTVVTITGSNFLQGLQVFFGGQLATSIQVLSPTSIKAVVPAVVPAFATPLRAKIAASDTVVNVVVQNPDGQQALFPEGYTYVNSVTPVITGITPIQGPVAGNQTVTINGSNLTGTTGVTFGGTAGTSVTVVNDSQVTVVTPAGTAGAVDVVLTTPGGAVTST